MEAEGRQNYIDALRGVAVALMVMVHAAATWNPFSSTQATPLAYLISGLGGLAAPLFVTLLGWGLMKTDLSIHQRWSRALFLIVCQVFVNISAPHLFEPLTPGVLSLMGLLILLEPIWAHPLRKYQNQTLSFAIISLSCFIVIFAFPEIQGEGLWNSRVHTPDVPTLVHHLILTGTYPLFPWLLFAVLGATIGRLDSNSISPFYAGVLTTGLIFSSLTLVWAESNKQTWALPSGDAVLTFFPSNVPFLIAAITGTILLWIISSRLLNKSTLLAGAGRCSLSVYVVHFIPLALLHDLNDTFEWTLPQSSFFVLSYTFGAVVLGALWYYKAPRSTLENLMRYFDKKPSTTEHNESE
ncbi:MAG TPA: acyltransferase [Poseidonia sp.]|nr:acyltransferase [Poseidonia sp.]